MPETQGYLGNPKLKDVNVNQHFTEYQLLELKKCSEDIVYFIENYIKIRNVDSQDLIKFKLRDYQRDLIQTFEKERFVIVKFPRQVGKTTSYVAYVTHNIIFNKNVKIAILANKGQTAREILERVQVAYMDLPPWIQLGIKSWNKGSIKLENDSEIIATNTSSNSIRGYSFNCITGDSEVSILNLQDQKSNVSIFDLMKTMGGQIPQELQSYKNINNCMLENKYSKIYWNLIKRCQERNWSRTNAPTYVEKHHIIPKCFSRDNSPSNLVFLTAREHFICHKLLIKMYEGKQKSKMVCALFIMCKNPNNLLKLNSKKYEKIKQNYSKERRILRLGTKHTKEIKTKISQSNLGKIISQETREKISFKNKGRLIGFKHTKEFGQKISKKLKGKKKTKEHIYKINNNPEKIRKTAEKHRGMKRSFETRLKQSVAKQNYIPWNKNKKGSMSLGYKWFHNPLTNETRMIDPKNIPIGFISGRK